MCGIFGVAGQGGQSGLRAAALTLRHRGPDGFAEWWSAENRVYLAHCRLSVIDLSEAGRQPMENEDGTIRITFNGEIFNFQELRKQLVAAGHQFRSHTDTEVIVHGYEQWGIDVVSRLRGIFAFAIWDEGKRRLFLARDHMGVKPLYYSLAAGVLTFASEPRAILAVGHQERKPEPTALLQYLQLGYVTGPQSMWHRIQRLPAGTGALYEQPSGKFAEFKFWKIPNHAEVVSEDFVVEQADELLTSAVAEQLISDVPLGVFLSGGLDSSLVSAKAIVRSPGLATFCIDFAGWPGSERESAQAVASHLRTRHLVKEINLARGPLSSAEERDRFFEVWDEPMANTTTLPAWELSRFARQTVTVALSGDGGDELFRGYGWYQKMDLTVRRRAALMLESVRRACGAGRQWPHACATPMEYFQFLHWSTLSRNEIGQLFPSLRQEIPHYDPLNEMSMRYSEYLESENGWQAVDVHTFLIDDNLARTDRASMSVGLEVRVPLLDHRLVELAFSTRCKERNARTKAVLRRILRPLVPAHISQREKQGFSFPIEHLVDRNVMLEAVQNGSLCGQGILNGDAFRKIFADSGRGAATPTLWLLFALENWAKRWWLGPNHVDEF